MLQYLPSGDQLQISWTHPQDKDIRQWVLYYKYAARWKYKILPPGTRKAELEGYRLHPVLLADVQQMDKLEEPIWNLDSIGISAVDRWGNESEVVLKQIRDFSLDRAPDIERLLEKMQ